MREFEAGSYLWIHWEDERKREALSGDQTLAVGGESRDWQDGIEDGARLRVAGSTTVSSSVVAIANILKQ